MSESGDDTLLAETLDRIFSEQSGQAQRQAAEDSGWAGECWDALAVAGLPWVGVPEAAGGSGGGVRDACTLIRLAGTHAVPLPLAECSLLGGWLVAGAGLQLPEGPLSVAVPRASDTLTVDAQGRVSGQLDRVPWGRRVAAVVGIAQGSNGPRVVLIDPTTASLTQGTNTAGEPRDALFFESVPLPSDAVGTPDADPGPELQLRGALSRALLMAGAMESVAALSVDYAGERKQFGRPIAAFQAVGGRLVRLSSEAELAALSAVVAAQRFAQDGPAAAFEVLSAAATASRAASEVATNAHQVHGAIGMTQEYPLHHWTRRLWAWRQEWGSERVTASSLGQQVVAAGADRLWPSVTSGLVTTGGAH